MISVTIFLPRFSASSVQSFVKTSSILVYIHHPLHPLERILTKNAGFPEAGGKKKKEGEKKGKKEDQWDGWTIEFLVERTKRGLPRKYSFRVAR